MRPSKNPENGGNVALSIRLGIALIGGLFKSNLPESMSSVVVTRNQGDAGAKMLWMWLSLMLLTAMGTALGNLINSDVPRETQAFLKGCTAGAMLAMVAQTMLPKPEHGGWLTDLLTVAGFPAAIFMGTFDEPHASQPDTPKVQVSHVLPSPSWSAGR